MNIISILEDKTNQIIKGQDSVALSGEEMNTLCDPKQLRAFKIYQSLPANYKAAKDIIECLELIRQGDCLYRTLEYCVITNRALGVVNDHIKFAGDEDAD